MDYGTATLCILQTAIIPDKWGRSECGMRIKSHDLLAGVDAEEIGVFVRGIFRSCASGKRVTLEDGELTNI